MMAETPALTGDITQTPEQATHAAEGRSTPGPWKVSGLGYVVARDPRGTLICQPYGSVANPDVMADMRLIAAAPDMKSALERARGCIKGLLARTPVRDVTETLAEIDAALARSTWDRRHGERVG